MCCVEILFCIVPIRKSKVASKYSGGRFVKNKLKMSLCMCVSEPFLKLWSYLRNDPKFFVCNSILKLTCCNNVNGGRHPVKVFCLK